MQAEMNPQDILSAASEVVEVVLRHTERFVEAVNILRAARSAIAGGTRIDPFQTEAELSVSEPASTQ